MKLFEYAVIYVPNDKHEKKGDKPAILVQPKVVLANDLKAANILAARDIPPEYTDKLNCVEVVIRPFA